MLRRVRGAAKHTVPVAAPDWMAAPAAAKDAECAGVGPSVTSCFGSFPDAWLRYAVTHSSVDVL